MSAQYNVDVIDFTYYVKYAKIKVSGVESTYLSNNTPVFFTGLHR